MSLLPFGGAAAAGPDPFTVVPDLASADGKAASPASRGDEPDVPFKGVLADAIHSPEDTDRSSDEANEKTQRDRPTAERESTRHDLTGLLLGAVNAKLRDEDQPKHDLSPAHLKASGPDGKGGDLAPHLRDGQPVGDFAPKHLHDTGAVEGKGHDVAAKLVDGLPLTGTGSAESHEDGVYRISLPRDLIQGSDQPKADGLSLTDTAFKNIGETAPASDRLEAQAVDPSRLHPELRARLQRVIERMQAEFGYDVKMVEGYRTPERQAQLYAQGRTIPGQIVTWTQDSAHTQGLAVDVIIDGSYDNPTAYQRFAQIAQQEGLRSLAPLDPGHVELDAEALGLPRNGSTVQVTRVQGDVARPADVAQVASVADVSRPAAVAQVAAVAAPDRIARVARPGHDLGPALGGDTALNDADGDGARLAALRARSPEGASDGTGFSAEVMPDRQVLAAEEQAARERRFAEARLTERTTETGPFTEPAPKPLHSALTPSSETTLQTASFPRVAAPAAGVEAMERAERVRELLAAQRRPVQQMTLAVDAGTADEALMKVSLRDGRVSTSIGVRDPFAAERLAAESAALRASLVRQGVEPGSIDVRAILPTLDSDAGFSTRRDGQQPFTPGLGEQLDGNAREDADSNNRSRSYWESLNKDRDQLFGTRGGNR